MRCEEFLHRYSDYDDSLLGPEELSSFRAHLDRCASCARYDRVLRKGRMLARQLPMPEPGVDFVPRLERRLWMTPPSRRRVTTGSPGGLAAALAAVTVTVVALWSLPLLEGEAVELAPVLATSPGPSVLAHRPAWSVPAPSGGGGGGGGAATAWELRVDPEGPATYSPMVTGAVGARSLGAVLASADPFPRSLQD